MLPRFSLLRLRCPCTFVGRSVSPLYSYLSAFVLCRMRLPYFSAGSIGPLFASWSTVDARLADTRGRGCRCKLLDLMLSESANLSSLGKIELIELPFERRSQISMGVLSSSCHTCEPAFNIFRIRRSILDSNGHITSYILTKVNKRGWQYTVLYVQQH